MKQCLSVEISHFYYFLMHACLTPGKCMRTFLILTAKKEAQQRMFAQGFLHSGPICLKCSFYTPTTYEPWSHTPWQHTIAETAFELFH